MRRALALLACATALLAAPSAASAVTVAIGEQGRALMTWPSPSGLQFAERTAGGAFESPQTIAPANVYPAFLAAGPGTTASVLAYDTGTTGLVTIRRPDQAPAFEAPSPLLQAPGVYVLHAAANARGDGAVLVRPGPGHLVLLTSVRGGPLERPQQIATSSETATVAVGGDGGVVVAWYEFTGTRGVRASLGTVDSPLGPPQRLSSGIFSDVEAALDDHGTATIAFARTDEDHRSRGAELVARRAGPDARFGAPRVVARGGPPSMGAGFASFRLAAAGTTTALAFDPNDAEGSLGVAIARGGGRFDRPQRPTPASRSFLMQPFNPAVAVDRAGDVLLAYTLGIYGYPVHATERRAGSDRFTSPRVLSTLGHGGAPSAALLTDRTRLVAWDDGHGDMRYTTRLAGRRPDLTPPRASVVLLQGTERLLRASNTARVRIRCSEACLVTGRATLRTTTGRGIVGAGERVLRAGGSFVKRFAFDPAKRAGRARGGSILRVTIDVENASGASRELVTQLRLARR